MRIVAKPADEGAAQKIARAWESGDDNDGGQLAKLRAFARSLKNSTMDRLEVDLRVLNGKPRELQVVLRVVEER
jgi:hypothetical protein